MQKIQTVFLVESMNKLGKIKLNKKEIKRIEIGIVLIIAVFTVILFIVTRKPSSEDAQVIVKNQYEKTLDVIGKVATGTNWIDIGDECIEQEGYIFCKSTKENMLSYRDLEKYIESVCTKSYTKEFLSKQEIIYKNIDGDLYVLDASRRKDVFYAGLKEIKIKSIASHKIQAQIICEYYIDLGKPETYTMSFDYVIEKSWGSWKTANFTLPY